MAPQRRSRDEWTAAGFARLGEVAIDKLRVDQVATALGVTKGSFYWHFEDRDEFLFAIVDRWETEHTEGVIGKVEAEADDPDDRARLLWNITGERSTIQAELAIRDWARREETVAARVRRVDDRRLAYVESLLTDLGVPAAEVAERALLAYSLVFSEYLITTSHSAKRRRSLSDGALRLLLRVDDGR